MPAPTNPFFCSGFCEGAYAARRNTACIYDGDAQTEQDSLQEKGVRGPAFRGAGLPERFRRFGRVGNWRADGLANNQDPFPFPVTARQTGRAVFLHPAFSWIVMPSPTQSYSSFQSVE